MKLASLPRSAYLIAGIAIVVLLVAITVVSYSAGHILNRSAKQQNLVYDQRCEDRPIAITTDRFRLFRTTEREPVSMEEVETFIYYNDYFDDVFEFFQVTAFGRNPDRLQAYFNQSGELTPIDEVTLAKWLPPAMNGLDREYHSVTMGVFDVVGDLNDDGISDIVAGTADTRCSEDRRDYLIVSGDNWVNEEKVSLEDSAVELNSSDWEKVGQAPVIDNVGVRSNGKSWLFNGRIIELDEKIQGSKTLSLDELGADLNLSDNALFVDGTVVDLNNAQLHIGVDPKNSADMKPVDLPVGTENLNGIAMVPASTLPDSSEIVLVSNSRLVFFDFKRGDSILTIDIDAHSTRDLSIGSYGDFDQDGVQDFWMSFPNAQNDQDIVIGVSYLVSGAKLRRAAGEGGQTDFRNIVHTTLRGEANIPTRQKSGIGYDISLKAGDIDGDGVPDFVTVAHYTYDNAGSLYVLPGKYVSEGAEYTVSNANILKVLGAPLSYLGTGLHAGDDWNKDGFDDILVGADVDHESGFSAGALYLISGKQISDRHTEQR